MKNKPKTKAKLNSGSRAYLAGISGGKSMTAATQRHRSDVHQAAPVTLPRLKFLEDTGDGGSDTVR